jgi:hypothetical protein
MNQSNLKRLNTRIICIFIIQLTLFAKLFKLLFLFQFCEKLIIGRDEKDSRNMAKKETYS